MRRRIFVDADVILDLLLAREPFFGAAAHLFLLTRNKKDYKDPELPILDAAECVQWVES